MRVKMARAPFDRLRANGFWRWIATSLALLAMTGTLLLVMTCGAVMAEAADCVYMDGGYCVSAIAEGTGKVLGTQVSSSNSPSPLPSPQMGEGERGVAFLNYYESLWNALVQAKLAVKEDMDKAFVEAGKAGGTKIGGVNLVVLSARTLQQLIDKNILTKEEAQGILNGARTGLPRPAASQ